MSKTLENSAISIKRETKLIQWKELALVEQQDFDFPQDAKVLSAAVAYITDNNGHTSEKLMLYYTTDPVNDNSEKTMRFFLHPTMTSLATGAKEFISTLVLDGGKLVLHLFANRLR